MSSYRRFITYLFWYKNNDKKTSCGFAKVEQRQNTGKMELHIKNCPGQNDLINIYFFTKEETQLPMILLGTVPLKKGMADAMFQFDCNAVGDSFYSMEQIRGIVIPLEEDLMVASLWDDETYDWNQLAEPGVKQGASKTGEKSGKDRWNLPTESEKGKKRTEDIITGPEETETGKEDIAIEPEESKAGKRNIAAEPEETETGKEDIAIEPEKSKADMRNIAAEPEEAETDREDLLETLGESEKDHEPGGEDLKIQSVPGAVPVSGMQSSWWNKLEGSYPKIYPFSGDKNVWGVQAQLRDIKCLPQKYWVLGNNSFLLHGYFNYGTILMGYMEAEKKYFLGVPGIFQNQERVLASLFGFPEFRTQQQCIQKTGEFGYWYRFLDF